MARIKIMNLPEDLEISQKELSRISGGSAPFGGLSEEMALRLQLLMDQRSKIYSCLSNVMKAISSTQDSIIQNIK
jgi:plasmid maintenance system antidote protein VapI